MLKNILYNQANAKFHIKPTINHIIGNKIHNIELIDLSSDQVNHQIADNVANNKAATQIHTTIQIIILPKKDQAVTSLGALSNIATSGLFIFFRFWVELRQIWELPIVGMLLRFVAELIIIKRYIIKNLNYFIFLNISEALEREDLFSVM